MDKRRFVIVTTTHRGVFYGYVNGPTAGLDEIELFDARMAIYWGTTRGLWELAETGPTAKSKISAKSPRIELRSITAVIDVTPEAAAIWETKV